MNLENYLQTHPKTYLIFDLDLTLARMEVDWSGVYEMLFSTVKNIDQTLVSTPPSTPVEYFNLVNRASSIHGIAAKQKIDNAVKQFEKENYHGYTPNLPLISFIHLHEREYKFALWTSNTSEIIQDFLNKERLISVFMKIITFADIQFTKPNPEGFFLIKNEDLSNEDYLMIGDSDNDEMAAKNAGIDFCKIDYFDRH